MPKKQIYYNRSLLDECIKRDSPQSVEIPEKLNRDVKIKYVCSCGKDRFTVIHPSITKIFSFNNKNICY